MAHYSMGSALPLSPAAGALLAAAINAPHPQSLAELGRASGLSRMAASRAASPLLEVGLLQQTPERAYIYNDAHPDSVVVEGLAWRYSGAVRPALIDGLWLGRERPWWPREDRYHYEAIIPDDVDQLAPDDLPAGPDLVTARDAVSRMRSRADDLRQPEAAMQQVFALWRTERARDWVHQCLHFGTASHVAITVLTTAAGMSAQGSADPRQACVSGRDWARAAVALSCEARDVNRVRGILIQATSEGGRIHASREAARRRLEAVNASKAATEDMDDGGYVDRARAAATAGLDDAKRDWEAGAGKWYHLGGVGVKERDVATLGDQILAVQLDRLLADLAGQVAQMAAHPCLASWEPRAQLMTQVDELERPRP